MQSPQGDISYLLRFYKLYVGMQVELPQALPKNSQYSTVQGCAASLWRLYMPRRLMACIPLGRFLSIYARTSAAQR